MHDSQGRQKEPTFTITLCPNASSLQVSVEWWLFTLPKPTNQITPPYRSLQHHPIRTLASLQMGIGEMARPYLFLTCL